MADAVQAFIAGVRSVEPFPPGPDRSIKIRQKITEAENGVRRDPGATLGVAAFLQQARHRAADEMARHKRGTALTRSGGFFQDVFEELSLRLRLAIVAQDDDTYRVEVTVNAADWTVPQVVKSDFYSLVAAQQWIDSDLGNTLINAVVQKFEK